MNGSIDTTTAATSKKLTLVSQEGENFRVDPKILQMSLHLRDMLEDRDNSFEEEVPLPGISSAVVAAIIEYCEHFNFTKDPFIQFPLPSSNMTSVLSDQWEAEFINRYNLEGKLELLKAVNYLNIPSIFEVCCAAIAAEFRGKNFD